LLRNVNLNGRLWAVISQFPVEPVPETTKSRMGHDRRVARSDKGMFIILQLCSLFRASKGKGKHSRGGRCVGWSGNYLGCGCTWIEIGPSTTRARGVPPPKKKLKKSARPELHMSKGWVYLTRPAHASHFGLINTLEWREHAGHRED
jgi:hypothetical protein